MYHEIHTKIKESKEEQDAYIREFSKVIEDSLTQENFDYDIKGRPKSIYSIHRKMKAQNVSFDEVYDKFAIRIIYKSDQANVKNFSPGKNLFNSNRSFLDQTQPGFEIGFLRLNLPVMKRCILPLWGQKVAG